MCRWGFVTHGCIDGFSRTITFLQTATNNTAKAVLNLFAQACTKFGLPSRVRCDRGSENVDVAIFMNLVRGRHRASIIAGKSVHNQRIERLWRDVSANVTSDLYATFYRFEDDNILDITDDLHLQALQFVFLPEINRRMDEFRHAWNSHRIRTAGNRSPEQLWLEGMLANANSDYTATTEIFGDSPSLDVRLESALQQFDLDIEHFVAQEGLQVPDVHYVIEPASAQQLAEATDHMTDLTDKYTTTLQLLQGNV